MTDLSAFLLHTLITALSLWLASHVFKGIKFSDVASLLIATALLGVVNSLLKPLIIFLTLPLTLVTLGFFLLVINALMLMLVSTLVRGFTVSGFWTAFFASLFIGFVNGVVEWMVSSNGEIVMQAPFGTSGGRWI